MTWRLFGGLFSLKALLLACVLAPVPATTIPTPAVAQFGIIIPGFDFRGGRRYYGRGYRSKRYSRRGGRSRGGGDSSAVSASPGTTAPVARSGSPSGGKVRGTVD